MAVEVDYWKKTQHFNVSCTSDKSGKVFDFIIEKDLQPQKLPLEGLYDIVKHGFVSLCGLGLVEKLHVFQDGRAIGDVLIFFRTHKDNSFKPCQFSPL